MRKCPPGCTCGKHSRSGNRRVYSVTCHPDRPHFSNGLCRQCYYQKWHRDNYWKNRDQILARFREDYKRLPKVYRRSNKESYWKNPEPYRLRARQYYAANREKSKLAQKSWNLRNPEAVKAIQLRYQARKRGASTTELVDYSIVLERDGLVCYLCGGPVRLEEVHLDHVVPLSRGGPHSYENLRVTHGVCNQKKHNRLPEELLGVLKEVM